MTSSSPRVIVTSRTAGPVHGFTTVFAMVDGGSTGEYQIADKLVGTQAEIDEIRAQSAVRQSLRDATSPGV